MMSIKKSHWPLTLLGGGVSLLNMLLPLVLVRILTASEVGQYKIYFLYLAFMPALTLAVGINNGLSYWAGKVKQRVSAARCSWAILLTIAICIFTLGNLFHDQITVFLGWDPLKVRLLVWGASVTILANFFDEVSVSFGQILRGALFGSGFDLIRNFSMAFSAYYFRTLEAVLWAHVGVMTAKVVIGAVWGAMLGTQRPSWNRSVLKAVLQYSFPVSLAAALSVAASYSDQIFLSTLLEPSSFAVYSFGCLLIPPLLIFEQSVNRVLIPRMSQQFDEGAPTKASKLFRDSISELSWVLFPAAVGLIVFAEPIVVLLFTKKFIASAFYLKIYSLTHILHVFPYDAVARARGDGKWILRRLGVFSTFSVILVYFLAKNFGATGALMGTVVSLALMRLSSMWSVHRLEKWKISKMFPIRDWVQYLLMCGVGVLAVFALRPVFGGGLEWFLCGGSVFTLIYALGTYSIFKRRRQEHKATYQDTMGV